MENVVHEPQMSPGVGDPPTGTRRGAASIGGTSGARRSRSRAFGAALAVGVGVGLTALAAVPSSASAADDCPNAAVRAQQGVQHLPNCLAYEKVTPNDKNGTLVGAQGRLSDDGNEAMAYANAPITDTVSGNIQTLLASRDSDGWSLEPLTNSPFYGGLRNTSPTDLPYLLGIQGMRRILFMTSAPYVAEDVAGGQEMASADYYVRESDGTFRWLTQPQGETYAPRQPIGTSIRHIHASDDFSTIVFGSNRVFNPVFDSVQRNHLWIWRDGEPYEMVDFMPNGTPATNMQVNAPQRTWMTPDLSTIVWQTSERVGPRTIVRLYARLGAGTSQARTVAVSESADGSIPCLTSGTSFQSLTLDGRYVRFLCGTKLTADAPDAGGAYVKDTQTGAVHFDDPYVDRGPLTTSIVPAGFTGPYTRPDGSYRLEQRASSSELWTVHLPTGEGKCMTCFGAVNPQPQMYGGVGNAAEGGLGESNSHFVTPEGHVFFLSPARLVPGDTNDFQDLYISIDNTPYLLSSGNASVDVEMGGVSLDGSTASFVTSSSLLAEDRDGGVADVYVVRRNGGFLREVATAECQANCQGLAQSVNPLAAPLSLGFSAPGDVDDEGHDPIVVSGSRTVRGTSLKIKVRTPDAGRVTVSGSGLRSATKSLSKATSATLTVRLSQRSLRRKGSVKVSSLVRFVPRTGVAQVKRVSFKFRRTASKKHGASRDVAVASNGKAAG